MDNPIWTANTSMFTIAKAEEKKLDALQSGHATILRGAFLTLVELDQSGCYKRKENDIRSNLKRVKDFLAKRPEQFLEHKVFAGASLGNPANNPVLTDDPESVKVTKQAQNQLQEAFDYVDNL